MPEKRRWPRKRRRFLIEFEAAGTKHTGFTLDVSAGSLFICSIRLPKLGTPLAMTLHVSREADVPLQGTVVRSFRGSGALIGLIPSGFGVLFSTAPPENYFRVLESL